MIIEWVLLIQIRFRKLLWVIGGKKKWWEKTHFEIFRTINCDSSTSTRYLKIGISWFLLIRLQYWKIVLESLWSREDMAKNPFSNFEFFTSENPCDSSSPPRRNHEPGTPEKFSKHGFSFFNPNIPLSLETRTKSKIDCLFHDNPHLNSKNPFWQNFKKFSKAKLKNPT
jgi:hypothetical protein